MRLSNWRKITLQVLLVLIIAFVVIYLIPRTINELILRPTNFKVVGSGVDWLIFWGGYLGAIISAAVAFAILYIQRKDNKEQIQGNKTENERQNKNNRIENEKQNKSNRQLQLNIMKYQQQSQWLDNFRNASLAYCGAFNHNDLVMLSNIMWFNPNDAFERIKLLFDRLTVANATFSFVRKHDSTADKLAKSICDIDIKYREVLNIVQYFVLYYIVEATHNNRQPNNFLAFLLKQNNGDNATNQIIQLLQQSGAGINNYDYFRNLVLGTITTATSFETDARDKLYIYIKQEQDNINKLLTENIES